MQYKLNSKRRTVRPRKSCTCTSVAKWVIVAVIAAVAIILIVALVAAFLLSPAHQVPTKVSTLASDYYENVFYQNMLDSPNFSGDTEKALSRHSERGLSTVTLRQLLLNDRLDVSSADADYLLKYCDEEATTVKFYPDAPYSRTSYHADITYSCNF